MKIAVIGGGIIGVTSALELQGAGHDVTIFSRDSLESTTSFAAGAVVYPVNVEESPRTLEWFKGANVKLTAMMAAGFPGISKIDWRKCSVKDNCPEPFWLQAAENGGRLAPDNIPYGNKSGVGARLFLLDVDKYYPALLQKFREQGEYKIAEVKSFESVPKEFDAIINCTGAYAGALTNDKDIHPARGQIVLVRNPGITEFYSSFDSKNYIYPRRDLCVLGGSYDDHEWDRTPDPALTQKIIDWATTIHPVLKNAEIADVRVGLRPIRSTVRLEKEIVAGRPVIHNYGHGGCGYTLVWPCAAEILKLL